MILKGSFREYVLYGIFFFVLLLFLRLPYAATPIFCVDEAFYATAANIILHGGVLYKNAVDHTAVITPYFYALIFKFFGANNMFAIHVSLIFLVWGTSMTIFGINILLKGKRSGFLAALFFIIFSFAYWPVDVWAFNTEWIAILFASWGAFFLLKYLHGNRSYYAFLSGISFGLGFFSKQLIIFHLGAALIFLAVFFIGHKSSLRGLMRSVILMMTGFASVVLFFILFFSFQGAWEDFRFCFWEYNMHYVVPAIPMEAKIKSAFSYLIAQGSFMRVNFFLMVLFVGGVLMTGVDYVRKERKAGIEYLANVYFIIWGIFAYMGASYSGRGYGHYYILILPPFCLLAAKGVSGVFDGLRYVSGWEDGTKILGRETKNIIQIFFIVFILFYLGSAALKYRKFILEKSSWGTVYVNRRELFLWAPVQKLAEHIKNNSNKNDRIFSWGFFPQIYVLSDRLPASKYIYCSFLTGYLPGATDASHIDTRKTIVPGSWEAFMKEMNNDLPLYIVDTTIGNIAKNGKYPPHKFKGLFDLLNAHYVVDKDFLTKKGRPVFRLYKRIDK